MKLTTLSLAVFCPVLTAVAVPAFTNASFEQGTGGYWINNPTAARLDPGEASDGKQSLGIKVVPGKTVSVVQGLARESGQRYRISFDLKGNDAQLRIAVMLQGKKPLSFYDDPVLKQPILPGAEYRRETVEIGPFPEKVNGQVVTKLMIYFNVTGEKADGKINLDNLSVELKAAPESSPGSLLKNGSFEQGIGQFWINRRKCVELDSAAVSHGQRSLKVTPVDKTVDVAQAVPMKAGEVYRVRFDAKSSEVESGPTLRLEVLMRGKKPLAFFAPKGEQKKFKEPVPLDQKFKTFEYEIGPFPENAQGTPVETLMFYWHVKPGAKPGFINLDNLQIEAAPAVQKKK